MTLVSIMKRELHSIVLQINKPLIKASHEGVVAEIDNIRYHLVPVLCSVKHDNPEGRDQLCLTTSNTARQICCLCYVPRDICATVGAPWPLKHSYRLEEARAETKAIVAESGSNELRSHIKEYCSHMLSRIQQNSVAAALFLGKPCNLCQRLA